MINMPSSQRVANLPHNNLANSWSPPKAHNHKTCKTDSLKPEKPHNWKMCFIAFGGMPCCSQTYESTLAAPPGETHQGSGREVIPSKQRQRNDGFGNSGRREGVGMPLKVTELQSLLDLFVFKEYSSLEFSTLRTIILEYISVKTVALILQQLKGDLFPSPEQSVPAVIADMRKVRKNQVKGNDDHSWHCRKTLLIISKVL